MRRYRAPLTSSPPVECCHLLYAHHAAPSTRAHQTARVVCAGSSTPPHERRLGSVAFAIYVDRTTKIFVALRTHERPPVAMPTRRRGCGRRATRQKTDPPNDHRGGHAPRNPRPSTVRLELFFSKTMQSSFTELFFYEDDIDQIDEEMTTRYRQAGKPVPQFPRQSLHSRPADSFKIPNYASEHTRRQHRDFRQSVTSVRGAHETAHPYALAPATRSTTTTVGPVGQPNADDDDDPLRVVFRAAR